MIMLCGLLVGGLTGCKDVPVNQTGEPTTEIVGTEQESPEETEGTTESESESESSAKPLHLGILGNKVALQESESLFYIPNEIIEGVSGQELHRFGNNLLVSYMRYDLEAKSSSHYLKVVSVETGELLCETVIPQVTYTGIQVLEDRVSVYDHRTGALWLLDETLQIVEEYQTPGGTVYLDSSATKAYCYQAGEGMVMVELATGRTERVLEGHHDVAAGNLNGNCVVLTYIDGRSLLSECAVLDLSTGTISEVDLGFSLVGAETDGSVWLANAYTGRAEYMIGRPEDKQGIAMTGGVGIPRLVGDSGYIMFTVTDETGNPEMKLYDEEGTFISSCKKNDAPGGLSYDPVWFAEGNGYFFTLTNSAGEDRLYFWDLSVEQEGASLETVKLGLETLPGTTRVSEELYQRARELASRYGVTVKIADECDTEFPSYTAQQTYDETMIANALSTLENVLAAYPEGFFDQLHYRENREVEFQFILNLSYKFSSNWYVGFMEENRGTNVIGVNIDNATLDRTLHHEISHVIEKKLEHDATYREDALFSEEKWVSFNPEWFAYFGDEGAYPEFTQSYEYSLYFVDGYAGTDSNEDRARIFERAATGHTPSFIGYPGIQKKLEYYCQCIRDAFDTTGWPEVTVWEQTLTEVKGR